MEEEAFIGNATVAPRINWYGYEQVPTKENGAVQNTQSRESIKLSNKILVIILSLILCAFLLNDSNDAVSSIPIYPKCKTDDHAEYFLKNIKTEYYNSLGKVDGVGAFLKQYSSLFPKNGMTMFDIGAGFYFNGVDGSMIEELVKTFGCEGSVF